MYSTQTEPSVLHAYVEYVLALTLPHVVTETLTLLMLISVLTSNPNAYCFEMKITVLGKMVCKMNKYSRI